MTIYNKSLKEPTNPNIKKNPHTVFCGRKLAKIHTNGSFDV